MSKYDFISKLSFQDTAGILTCCGYALRENISLGKALEEMGFLIDGVPDFDTHREIQQTALLCLSQPSFNPEPTKVMAEYYAVTLVVADANIEFKKEVIQQLVEFASNLDFWSHSLRDSEMKEFQTDIEFVFLNTESAFIFLEGSQAILPDIIISFVETQSE